MFALLPQGSCLSHCPNCFFGQKAVTTTVLLSFGQKFVVTTALISFGQKSVTVSFAKAHYTCPDFFIH
jgi:hypothetical protein